ncbi:hypothetical protein VKT23_000016 [Stygiomarasmius scandens]|uniref:Uncharacterized protein n=1 Tax=Marasmiellus scandens TaxID=2682957 RepID=A0ABR1K3B7_9AGAR
MVLLPYNITLSSQTAYGISYSPSRNGNISTGWNVSYSDGVRDMDYGNPVGVGVDQHRTSFAGATMELDWTGTAVYLYGSAEAGSYTISVDNENVDVEPGGGLLGSKSGLDYGAHTVKLEVTGGSVVAFQHADVTIGVGYSGSEIKNETIKAVNNGSQNDFFTYSSNPSGGTEGWNVEVQEFKPMPDGSTRALDQQMRTNAGGATVSFTLTNTSAFFLWGAVNNDHTPKIATLSSQKDGQLKNVSIDDSSSIFDFTQVLYWESDLDRNETYTVQITNVDNSKYFSFSSLDIIDGGNPGANKTKSSPTLTTDTGSTTSSGNSAENSQSATTLPQHSTKLGTGAVAGIAVGGAAAALIILAALFAICRRRRNARNKSPTASPITPFISTNTSGSGLTATIRETDSGPVFLPPRYDDRWASSSGEFSSNSQTQTFNETVVAQYNGMRNKDASKEKKSSRRLFNKKKDNV